MTTQHYIANAEKALNLANNAEYVNHMDSYSRLAMANLEMAKWKEAHGTEQ
jgi:hypothetical protein